MRALFERALCLKWNRFLQWLPAVAVVAALCLAYKEIQGHNFRQIVGLVFDFPVATLCVALLLTAMGYVLLAAYDGVALYHLGKPMPWRQVLLAGFTSFAVSNSAGHAMVSGGALRYRFYSGWGLGNQEIVEIILLSTVTYFLANGTLLALSYLATPTAVFDDHHLAGGLMRVVMWIVMLMLVGYWALVLSGKRTLSWRTHSVTLPGKRITLLQSFIGAGDLLLAAAVLYVLLRQHMDISFAVFLNAYLLAQVLGLFSQSPGGIGVFESAFLYLLTGGNPSAEVLAALLVYRVVYYLLPLLVACMLILIYEFREREVLRRRVAAPWLALQQLLPHLLSLLMLVGGAVLLFSGATPGKAGRLAWLGEVLPVSLIETSHALASIAGVLMLVLARAIKLKLRSAYYAALLLLAIGVLTSLLKGGDYEEAGVLLAVFAVLVPAKRVFYRPSRVSQAGMTAQWVVLILLILGFAVWLGFFSYREIVYSHDLWWMFEPEGDVPRFLRTTLASVMVLGIVFGFFFLRRSRFMPHFPDAQELAQAESCVRLSSDSNQFLALTGDKYFFWNEEKTGFISYVTTEKYWIVMGDPCGTEAVQDELLWQFREAADRFGAKLVFYRVRPSLLTYYLDLGLTMVKLGEEAIVNLSAFTLKGQARASLRHAYNKMQRDAWQFSVIPKESVASILPALETISQQWLEEKNTREKGISLGFFDKEYILRSDVAVIRKDEKIVAFANLWKPDNLTELSMDLMRYSTDAPNGTMEYLTICLMLWAQEQGYQSFNLGMAPLSGLESHALAPLWHKIGHSVFRYGNEFYNFQGLRSYKDKFDPVWEPRYLAVPSVFDVPTALLQITTMIAGGIKGIFSK
jgi:phosphatidylglycerol lysyltransferase